MQNVAQMGSTKRLRISKKALHLIKAFIQTDKRIHLPDGHSIFVARVMSEKRENAHLSSCKPNYKLKDD